MIRFKNCFNKFISSTSKNNYWLSKFIIKTSNLVSKTTRNVILIFVWVEPFITFNTVWITLKISISFKWSWYLFEIIFTPNCSFFWSYRLCTNNAQTKFFMFCQHIFTTKTLKTTFAKAFFVFILCFVKHKYVKIFDVHIIQFIIINYKHRGFKFLIWNVNWKNLFIFIAKHVDANIVLFSILL